MTTVVLDVRGLESAQASAVCAMTGEPGADRSVRVPIVTDYNPLKTRLQTCLGWGMSGTSGLVLPATSKAAQQLQKRRTGGRLFLAVLVINLVVAVKGAFVSP